MYQDTERIWKAITQLKRCKVNCSQGLPSLPLNSVQYNNDGAFFGDALFTRDPTTNDVIIAQESGTVQFGLQQNSDILGLGVVSGSFNYWKDSASNLIALAGVGDNTGGGGNPAISFIDTRNIVTGDFANFQNEYDGVKFSTHASATNGTIVAETLMDNTGVTMQYTTDGITFTKIIIDTLVTITNVPSYANDLAATGGGLTSGQLYSTTTGGSTFLKIVP